MYKAWLLLFPILCCLLSCDALSTGGNPSEGRPCNQKILKVHPELLRFDITMTCPYEKKCDVGLGFGVAKLGDSLDGMCFGGGAEWRFESIDTSMIVATKDWKTYPVILSMDDHLHFSLIDEDDVEKKYDIDLSSIINSYTVRGDSIDVHVMENCNLQLLFCSKEIVYGSKLRNGEYTFSANEGCGDHYIYKCIWHNQGSLETDDLDIYASIYWKK